MRKNGILRVFCLIFCASFLFACGEGGGGADNSSADNQGGAMTFALDLQGLGGEPTVQPMAIGDPTITAVSVTLSRDGFDPIAQALTVANNVATGRVENLATGYWHVDASVYSGDALIYEGQVDVNIIAGVEVACQILFDPVTIEPTTGALAISVGMNPMPGYRILNQAVSKVLFDEAARRFYILDASAALIAVYNADTLNRIEDIPLPQAPRSIALDSASGKIFLGYPSGQVYTLVTETGEMTLLGEALGDVLEIVPLNPNYLLLAVPGQYYLDIKVMSRSTGQIASTKGIWNNMVSFIVNQGNGMVYAHHTGVSPTDIHFLLMDMVAGKVLAEGDSVYHGDYALGTPLRLIRNGTRVATSSGNLFTSSSVASEDLRYAGNLGFPYIDLAADDAAGYLYLLNRDGIQKLLVLNEDNLFLEKAVDLAGTPKHVFSTADTIVVFTVKDGTWFSRPFAKTALGI